ncbi:MAG: prepilin-type N-terminal cleavage/methylation domain-containing protein [Myxococcales bacterium]|nr:prepilin-type N-terminal cleavage/methylation domain-containing protein [Myxococcales bacterium]
MFPRKMMKLRTLRQTTRLSGKRSRLRAQIGMTLLEIMIVLAIIAVVMGTLVGPKVLSLFQGSKVDTTRMVVVKIANEAYTHWSMKNSGKQCPDSLKDLEKYRNKKDSKDGWGNELIMLCGSNAPAGATTGFGILSLGPDGKQGTNDDIKSWE